MSPLSQNDLQLRFDLAEAIRSLARPVREIPPESALATAIVLIGTPANEEEDTEDGVDLVSDNEEDTSEDAAYIIDISDTNDENNQILGDTQECPDTD